ncbi:alpha/beta fold hydrolase [Mycobacterium sp. DL592]|uniref:alpha/beta fold hydrolase n=1 Tax=Mycobacterium sp. DL592 TaxID=2675524 RepID=UPI00141DB1BC|nr:alpha/beta fold hydrolase [Mycobacterium sp. DL592]
MRRLLAAAACLLLVSGCSNDGTPAHDSTARAVVVVSGLASDSPFTTTQSACADGLPAGSADSAIRDDLVSAGKAVFTAPAYPGPGQVRDQSGFGAFGQCPAPLPDTMTIDSTGRIDTAGDHLARFLDYLHTDKGVDEVDLVGHSMGGLYARAAIRALTAAGSPVRVRSLVTIGTPWQGSYLADYAEGAVPLTACAGDQFCESQMRGYVKDVAQVYPSGSAHQLDAGFLKGWNDSHVGALDAIPVTLIGGSRFARPGDPAVWPNDGIVALRSALAVDVSDRVLPHRRCYTVDDTHSDYVSMVSNLPRQTALTWDPRVLDAVRAAIEHSSLDGPNRTDCPA